MKTITGNLSYRKQYALQCFLKGIDSRSRDNCFEMGDGDEVMVYLMKRATEDLPDATDARIKLHDVGLTLNSPEWRLIKKHDLQKKLLTNLKKNGTFEYWTQMIKDKGLTV
jgi:hypothetical protein